MRLIKPSFEIWTTDEEFKLMLERIERAGRVCYKSENKITEESAEKFIKGIIKKGHLSVIEHCNVTVKIICDRGVTHELVRHRLASYSQESTRFCNYSGGVTFIIPPWMKTEPGEYHFFYNHYDEDHSPEYQWFCHMLNCECAYQNMISNGWSPQQARSVLPNSLKTEIVMTANLREWKHIFDLRCSEKAHPQMREIMVPLREEFVKKLPVIFGE